jgi:hypothetical protein
VRVLKTHLCDDVDGDADHEGVQGVLEDLKLKLGLLLLTLSCIESCGVVKIASLLVQIDRPALQVCVQFKHD